MCIQNALCSRTKFFVLVWIVNTLCGDMIDISFLQEAMAQLAKEMAKEPGHMICGRASFVLNPNRGENYGIRIAECSSHQ